MGAKLDFYKTALKKRSRKGFQGYPVATIAYYGPDDRRATKVAVGIVRDEDDPAEMSRWHVETGDIRRTAEVLEAVFRFVQARQVRSVAMMEEILGCPHEEGIDYPKGEACPACPFWAGRERPLDLDQGGTSRSDAPFFDRRAMEKDMAAPTERSSTKLEEAQDLMWDAWDTRDSKRRVEMARRALEISPDCADAYVMLAEETARSVDEAIRIYEKGVAAGERALGPKQFEEDAGHFWGILETRPYMRARSGLAQSLHEAGRLDEAIGHFEELLRLNPNDNQGNRDLLAPCYMEAGRDTDALDLLNRYPEGITASWTYTMALVQFRLHGDTAQPQTHLREALDSNPHVPNFLCGKKRMPRQIPGHYSLGSRDEAVIYVDLFSKSWKQTPEAIAWLKREAGLT
jgi:tetratricopeptide (TPR) repeat protein